MRDCKLADGLDEVNAHLPKRRTVYDWIKLQKKLTLRKASRMEIARIRASTKDNLQAFFDLFQNDYSTYKYKKELIVFSCF